MSKFRKVLVTGGGGFIGSYIVEELLRNGLEVLILDHSLPGVFKREDPKVQYFLGDVRDPIVVTEAAAHVDGIIHLAAVLGTQETIKNPSPAAITNIVGGLNVFEASVQYNLPVVYAGVGNYWMRDFGAGTYTITKTTVEDFARMFNQFRGANISVVRPVNAYGARQSIAAPFGTSKVRKIMPSFVCRALLGEPIEIYGDGTQVSDCIHVYDVAKVFVAALKHTAEHGYIKQAIDVGPPTSNTVAETAKLVVQYAKKLTGKESELVFLPMRPGEVPNAVVAANQETTAPLGENLSASYIPLADGIQATVQWYHDNWLPSYLDEQL